MFSSQKGGWLFGAGCQSAICWMSDSWKEDQPANLSYGTRNTAIHLQLSGNFATNKNKPPKPRRWHPWSSPAAPPAASPAVEVRELFLPHGRDMPMVDAVPAGCICSVQGLQASVLKTATLASDPRTPACKGMARRGPRAWKPAGLMTLDGNQPQRGINQP